MQKLFCCYGHWAKILKLWKIVFSNIHFLTKNWQGEAKKEVYRIEEYFSHFYLLQVAVYCCLCTWASVLHCIWVYRHLNCIFWSVFSAGTASRVFYGLFNLKWSLAGAWPGLRRGQGWIPAHHVYSHAPTKHPGRGRDGIPWLSLDVYETLKMSGEHLIKSPSSRWGRLQKVITHGEVVGAICSLCI